jgi:single-stranded-DNA-specific exonuclease
MTTSRETSIGREWKLYPRAPAQVLNSTELPPIVAQVLHNRGVTVRSEIDSLFNPLLHDPALLSNMDSARQRLYRAIESGEIIGIFGDFDVDGVTGTALMAQGLSDLGAKVEPYIPHRVTEGHGPNEAAMRVLRERGASVMVTVDCGVTSLNEVALAQDLGMDVIITDHHIPPTTLPPALAIIDPKLDDGSEYPFPELSGAGLAFKLVQGLYDLIGQPWSRDLLELAALSTVADLVPLKDENRFLVKEGLKELSHTRRPGLLALYRDAGIRAESMDVETISFAIAPRLNAAGRLDHADISYRLLLTRSNDEAERLATQLGGLNRARQHLSEEAYDNARETVLGWSPLPPILILEGEQLSPGIAGLVATRLVEDFYRPAVVMSRVDGVIRASARSITEFHVGDALSQCGDLFVRHGGHRQAAGFTMHPENLPQLRERLGRIAADVLEKYDLKPGVNIDAEVSVTSLKGETFRWLKDLEPFGVDNPTPVFLTRNLRPVESRPVGRQGNHLKLKLKEGRVVWDAIAFRQVARWVPATSLLDVVYTVGTDRRGGTEMMALKVMDFRPSVS